MSWLSRLIDRMSPYDRPDTRPADMARMHATLQLLEAEKLIPRAREVAAMLRAERAENHFSERIRAAYAAHPHGGTP